MSTDIQQKRDRFFEAATPLFDQYGFRKTTVEEICRAAGMSKRTYYDLFDDKVHFFAELLMAVMDRAVDNWETAQPDGLDPLEQLAALLDLYEQMLRDHPSLRLMLEDVELMRIMGEKLDQIRLVQIGGPLHSILTEGQQSGHFRQLDPEKTVWLIFSLLDSVYLLLPGLMEVPGALDDARLAEETKQFILRGLGVGPDNSPGADRGGKRSS